MKPRPIRYLGQSRNRFLWQKKNFSFDLRGMLQRPAELQRFDQLHHPAA
jgi:hypothetical protein